MPATELAPLHVALLRGINVSGKNTLPMAELASIFVEAGCEDVRTYIQSGNVVFRAKGMGRSKLTNKYFDSKLGTTSTLRNWKTVLRLAAMLDG
jgi:uncharacterized protein (DUF1697 family)